jgi:hypothetical protein
MGKAFWALAISATLGALLAPVSLAAPALATQPASNRDVTYMVSYAVAAYDSSDPWEVGNICPEFYDTPAYARNAWAAGFDDAWPGQFTRYDRRRAAWRFLNIVCSPDRRPIPQNDQWNLGPIDTSSFG